MWQVKQAASPRINYSTCCWIEYQNCILLNWAILVVLVYVRFVKRAKNSKRILELIWTIPRYHITILRFVPSSISSVKNHRLTFRIDRNCRYLSHIQRFFRPIRDFFRPGRTRRQHLPLLFPINFVLLKPEKPNIKPTVDHMDHLGPWINLFQQHFGSKELLDFVEELFRKFFVLNILRPRVDHHESRSDEEQPFGHHCARMLNGHWFHCQYGLYLGCIDSWLSSGRACARVT